jgi:autotransporter translocation and assembly factor TamB
MRISWLLIVPLVMLGNIDGVTAQVADIAGVLPGDRWVYEVTDEVTGDIKQTTTVVVLDVSEKEINTRVSTRGAASPRQIVFDRGWSRIDDSSWKYTPSDGTGIKMPLQVGRDWRFDSKATNFNNGTAMSVNGQSKVVGTEKLTTSAGTFDTFKVETTLRQINANDQTKSSTLTSTLWYAPTVNRWVRKTYKLQVEGRLRESQTEELTDYSRKP